MNDDYKYLLEGSTWTEEDTRKLDEELYKFAREFVIAVSGDKIPLTLSEVINGLIFLYDPNPDYPNYVVIDPNGKFGKAESNNISSIKWEDDLELKFYAWLLISRALEKKELE